MMKDHKHNYTYLLSVKYRNYHKFFEEISDIFNAQRMFAQLMGSSQKYYTTTTTTTTTTIIIIIIIIYNYSLKLCNINVGFKKNCAQTPRSYRKLSDITFQDS
jgi:hypothetical protein